MLQLQILPQALTVCKVEGLGGFALSGLFFIGSTDNELSLVCETECTPAHTLEREDGWRGFRVEGEMDFSLVGILAEISGILAESGVSLFAVSTYNTDYVLVKADKLDRALKALSGRGYAVEWE